MNKRLDNLLVKNHPIIFADRFASMRVTAMCWGFDCGDGWYKIIKEAADKIEVLAETSIRCKATQVKEKYGTLRFYMDCETAEMSKVIREAERKSSITCEVCGKKGKWQMKNNWCFTACAKHSKNR